MSLVELPKKGDMVRYLGGENEYFEHGMEVGGIYEVIDTNEMNQDVKIKTDNGRWWIYGKGHSSGHDFDKYELVEPKAPSALNNAKVGDFLRYLGGDCSNSFTLTVGSLYKVKKITAYCILIETDFEYTWEVEFDGYNTHCFELVGSDKRFDLLEYLTEDGDDLSALYPKYFKDVSGIDSIDVYMTHELFGIDDPSGAIQHASKKLLLSGVRTGGKSKYTDIKEARDTLNRWLDIHAEDEDD